MASKQLPIVGEAFLGSDPLVQKVVRVTFGSTGFSGSNDVDVTTAGGQDLLTFADSNFLITNILFNVMEAFSVGAIIVGVDSDPNFFSGDTGGDAADFTSVGAWDLVNISDTAALLALGAFSQVSNRAGVAGSGGTAGAVPADSDDSIVVSYSGAATLGPEGHAEMYVFYIETEDQP